MIASAVSQDYKCRITLHYITPSALWWVMGEMLKQHGSTESSAMPVFYIGFVWT